MDLNIASGCEAAIAKAIARIAELQLERETKLAADGDMCPPLRLSMPTLASQRRPRRIVIYRQRAEVQERKARTTGSARHSGSEGLPALPRPVSG